METIRPLGKKIPLANFKLSNSKLKQPNTTSITSKRNTNKESVFIRCHSEKSRRATVNLDGIAASLGAHQQQQLAPARTKSITFNKSNRSLIQSAINRMLR